jgi:hypothetical protein
MEGGMSEAEIKASELRPGFIYKMVHARKGIATVECIDPYNDGGKSKVVEGELRGISDHYGPGDVFTTVNNLARFYRLEENK